MMFLVGVFLGGVLLGAGLFATYYLLWIWPPISEELDERAEIACDLETLLRAGDVKLQRIKDELDSILSQAKESHDHA